MSKLIKFDQSGPSRNWFELWRHLVWYLITIQSSARRIYDGINQRENGYDRVILLEGVHEQYWYDGIYQRAAEVMVRLWKHEFDDPKSRITRMPEQERWRNDFKTPLFPNLVAFFPHFISSRRGCLHKKVKAMGWVITGNQELFLFFSLCKLHFSHFTSTFLISDVFLQIVLPFDQAFIKK